jgi:hypothetical protein
MLPAFSSSTNVILMIRSGQTGASSNRRSAVNTCDGKGSPHKRDAFYVSCPTQALILLNDS